MAHFTKFTDLNPQDEYLDNADFEQDDWDLIESEDIGFDEDDDTWSQGSIDDLDIDDLDDFEEDADDFHGAF